MLSMILIFIVGLLIGCATCCIITNNKSQRHIVEKGILQVKLDEAKKQKEEAKQDMIAHYQQLLSAQEKRHNDIIESQEARFNETLDKVKAQMKISTEELLKQRQEEFQQSSSDSLGQIVNPLKDTIEKMKKSMDDNTLKQTSMGGEMKIAIEHMMNQSMAAQKSTEELTRVFKHKTKVQGDWGERVLDELLESQGLTRGLHYEIQAVIRDASGFPVKTDAGSIMRPDVILHLDTERDVIIDSKVSLTAYMDYVNADNEGEADKALKAHVDSIQKHVKELSAKDYSSYIKPPKKKMEYVIMFVPHSAALWTALNSQPDLWRKAMEKNVFIADEQTLYAALRMVSLTWTQIKQAQNHEKVYELAEEMMNRVGLFVKRYQKVGASLQTALKAYDEGDKSLQPSGQSILQTCKKLQNLGAKQSITNPLPQLNAVDDEDYDEPEH